MNEQALRRRLRALVAACALTAGHGLCLASPGAHGPNGEHLDQAPDATAGTATHPRFEARTETFELVGTLAGGELSLLIDRFETNDPVLGANVEVESGGLKAPARFHADHGDYAVDDAAMLKLLATAGTHALVITVLAGQETDLLDAKLVIGADAGEDQGHAHGGSAGLAAHAHDMSPTGQWIAGAVLLALIVLAAFLLRRRGRDWSHDHGERT